MKFLYEAKTAQGQEQVGEIEADNRDAALDVLRKNKLIIVSLKSSSQTPVLTRQITWFERINLKDVALFTRQLAVMIEAKVPLVQSLRSLADSLKKKSFQDKIRAISHDIEGGTLFSDALAKYPKLFSSLFVGIIKSGEVSGRLQESLLYLADHSEREYDLRSKIKGAMIYPAFILLAFIGVAIAMLVVVIPKITGLLEGSKQEIPAITRILINTSEWFQAWWWIIVILILIIIVFSRIIVKKNQAAQYRWNWMLLRLPIFGNLLQKIYLARFSENLGTLISSGLPVVKALQVSAKVIGNNVYQQAIDTTIEKVRAGGGIGVNLQASKEIPKMVSDMISVGEQSGQLDKVLASISNFYKREVDALVNNLTKLLEPIIIIAMGIMVAFLVAAVLIPIYQVSTGAGAL